jgi:hypothetical protein
MRELKGLVILSAAKDPMSADTISGPAICSHNAQISGPELQPLNARGFSRRGEVSEQ